MAGLVPAIHVFLEYVKQGRGCPAPQTSLRSLRKCRLLWPGMTGLRETRHETRRPHRKAARHQAREGLELETHLREDRRLFRGADRRRHPRPDETDEAAGGERG